MIIISEALASLIRIILCLFFVTRERPKVRVILTAVIATAIGCAVLNYCNLSFLYLSAFEIVLTIVCLRLSDNKDRRKNLFFCIMYEIGIALWFFILSETFVLLTEDIKFSDRNEVCGQLPLWVVNVILTIVAVLIFKGKAINLRTVSVLAVLSIFGVVAFSEETVSGDISFTYLILSVILLSGVMVYRLSGQYETEKELAELKERQAELLERDYNVLNKAYSDNARTFHDMHNHIGAVRSLLVAEKYDKAIEYLDDLQKPVSGIASNVWTGDETVDYLINSRIAAAENEGISFETQIEFPKGTNIGGADLCAVLGNLLDNAFDAVRKDGTSDGRSIKLTIRRINCMLVIKVVNTFGGEISISDGKLMTTKSEKGLHGWGIESARTAAEKYNGTVQTTAEKGIFTAVATMSFDKE